MTEALQPVPSSDVLMKHEFEAVGRGWRRRSTEDFAGSSSP
jgi:hypothetical protein